MRKKIKNKNNKDRKMDMVLNMQIHPYRKLIRQLNISCKYWSNISAKHIVSHPKWVSMLLTVKRHDARSCTLKRKHSSIGTCAYTQIFKFKERFKSRNRYKYQPIVYVIWNQLSWTYHIGKILDTILAKY